MTIADPAGYSSCSHWKDRAFPTSQFLLKGHQWLTLYVNSHLKNAKPRDWFPCLRVHLCRWGNRPRLRNVTTIPDTQHTPQLANPLATVHLGSSRWSNSTHLAAISAFTVLGSPWCWDISSFAHSFTILQAHKHLTSKSGREPFAL